MSLEVGSSYQVRMTQEGFPDATVTIESIVAPAVPFAGKPLTRQIVSWTSVFPGGSRSLIDRQVSTSYVERAERGLVRELGRDHEQSGDFGSGRSVRTVFDPAIVDASFTLARGQSLTRTTRGLVTTTGSTATPSPFEQVDTVRFEDRVSLTINGKTYDTCRFAVAQEGEVSSRSWHHVGTGIPIRIENYGAPPRSLEMRLLVVNGEEI